MNFLQKNQLLVVKINKLDPCEKAVFVFLTELYLRLGFFVDGAKNCGIIY